MPRWLTDYFEMKAIEEKQTQGKLSTRKDRMLPKSLETILDSDQPRGGSRASYVTNLTKATLSSGSFPRMFTLPQFATPKSLKPFPLSCPFSIYLLLFAKMLLSPKC